MVTLLCQSSLERHVFILFLLLFKLRAFVGERTLVSVWLAQFAGFVPGRVFGRSLGRDGGVPCLPLLFLVLRFLCFVLNPLELLLELLLLFFLLLFKFFDFLFESFFVSDFLFQASNLLHFFFLLLFRSLSSSSSNDSSLLLVERLRLSLGLSSSVLSSVQNIQFLCLLAE